MAKKKRVTDDEIRNALIRNPELTSSRIMEMLGLSRSAYTYKRFDAIKKTIQMLNENPPNFSEIRAGDRLLRHGKRLVVVSAEETYLVVRKMDMSTETISRKDFSKTADLYKFIDSEEAPVKCYKIPPGTEIIDEEFRKEIIESSHKRQHEVSPTTEEILADVNMVSRKNDQSVKADDGKPRLTLVPRRIITAIAEIREYGNAKYGDPENWRDVDPDRYKDAAFRHFMAYLDNPDGKDEESGLPHINHLACNIAFLIEMEGTEREEKVSG
ncbi:MAG: dATP/dGTP diphosphohydrolase domain-containing protein [Anaerovoracaceae bacterium]|jgi:hypothetical protein